MQHAPFVARFGHELHADGGGSCRGTTDLPQHTMAPPPLRAAFLGRRPADEGTSAEREPVEASARHGTGLQADRRGSYDRSQAAKSQTIDEYACIHKEKIRLTHLGAPCLPSCKFGQRCLDEITKPVLYKAHEYSFCDDDGELISKKKQSQRWRRLVDSWVTFSPDGTSTEEYRIGSYRACREAARAAYGMQPSRLSAMLRVAKGSPGGLESQQALRSWDASVASARAAEKVTSKSEAGTWWLDILELWDHMPAEFTIAHPRLVWSELYSKIYLREIEHWGSAEPLRAGVGNRMSEGKKGKKKCEKKNPKPPGSWFRARHEAMRIISIKYTGHDATGEPNVLLNQALESWRPLQLRRMQRVR